MAFVSGIRTYFDTQIKLVDSTIEDYGLDPLGLEDTSGTERSRYYKLLFGATTTEKVGNIKTDTTEITLQLYANKQRAEQDAFDDLYQKALNIRDCVTDVKAMAGSTVFTEVLPGDIEPSAVDDNDNAFNIDITFSIRKDYC